jgi:hypothetical protein
MPAISAQTATLIAAAVAAVASVLSLCVNVFAQRLAERRTAIRAEIAKNLGDLGEAIHQTVAITTVLLRRIEEEDNIVSWREKAKAAKAALETVRRKVRYSLFGIDIGLRTLVRLPDWILHKRKTIALASGLQEVGEDLRNELDRVIVNCYRFGRLPTWRERRRVQKKAEAVQSSFEQKLQVPKFDVEEEVESTAG